MDSTMEKTSFERSETSCDVTNIKMEVKEEPLSDLVPVWDNGNEEHEDAAEDVQLSAIKSEPDEFTTILELEDELGYLIHYQGDIIIQDQIIDLRKRESLSPPQPVTRKISEAVYKQNPVSSHTRVLENTTDIVCSISPTDYETSRTSSSDRPISRNTGSKQKKIEKKRYNCELCAKSAFKRFYLAFQSEKEEEQDKTLTSYVACKKCFTLYGHLKTFPRIDQEDIDNKCKICGKKFSQREHLLAHRRTHSGEQPFQCPICKKCFTQKGHLTRHHRVHTGARPFLCHTCGKCFTEKSVLTTHILVHTEEQPHKCETCGKCFSLRCNLINHVRIHTGQQPYKCKECGKAFTQSNYLKAHNRTHTGEKPFKCETCDKSFSQRSSLNAHVRIHTGEKPYKCVICDKCFSRQSYLLIHNRAHEKGTI